MTPAVANGVVITCIHPVTLETKSVKLASRTPALIFNTFPAVTAVNGACPVTVDDAPAIATISGPQSVIVTVTVGADIANLVVVGSIVTLVSGHVGTVLAGHGAGSPLSVL